MNKLKMMIFGHRTNVEYWIPIKDVIITYDFQLNSPNPKKFWGKVYGFKKYGTIGKIKLNKDFELVAQDDEFGRRIQDMNLVTPKRARRKRENLGL